MLPRRLSLTVKENCGNYLISKEEKGFPLPTIERISHNYMKRKTAQIFVMIAASAFLLASSMENICFKCLHC
jgi:hypothetical protein